MEEKEAFKYCPICGGSLDIHQSYNDHLKCSVCNFTLFLNQKPTVSAIILNDKQEILLTKRNFDPDKNTWEMPGGFIDKNETAEEAVKREIKEELGINIFNPKYIFSLTCSYEVKDVSYEVLVLYFFCGYSGRFKLNEENLEYKFFDLNNLTVPFHKPHGRALKIFINNIKKQGSSPSS